MVPIDLSGRTAIVTGAGQGLGAAIALAFGKAGANTVVSDLVLANAEAVAQQIIDQGGKALPVQTDVSKRDQVDSLVEAAVAHFGPVRILCNNAGVSIAKLFLETTEEELDKMLSINLKGCYYSCMAALPHMIAAGEGKIVNISSMAPKAPSNFHSLYGATKAGIISMTQCIASEYGPQNIKANCVCPGIIRTKMWDKSLNSMDSTIAMGEEALWSALVGAVPLARPQSPEDIANCVLFLASDLAENISAQAINVNGGQLAN